MPEIMEFPDSIFDFIKEYSFYDDQHIYTNGTEVIPVFRVEQMLAYYFGDVLSLTDGKVKLKKRLPWIEVDKDNYITQECLDRMNKDIENYNKGIVSDPLDFDGVEQ